MDENQRLSLYQSIAISVGIKPDNLSGHITPQHQNEAFLNLEQFKKYENRVAACIELLQIENHLLTNHDSTGNLCNADLTIPTKLYALDVLSQYVKKTYNKLNESERLGLRWGVLTAARQLVVSSENLTPEAIRMGSGEGARILGMKIAALIADFAVRDFPQRWNSFVTDVFVPQEQGGIWGSSNNETGVQNNLMLGIKMSLECLKVITENCTDSDFNAKISSGRRNDVLIGFNEVSSHILPLIFNILSQQYTIVSTGNQTIQEMESYLLANGRNISQMSMEERAMYDNENKKIMNAARILVDCLITLKKFCLAMPLEWMFGNKCNLDFITAYFTLFRERTASIQLEAIACLEALAIRKLEFDHWFLLLSNLPQAVAEANQIIQKDCERRGENFFVEQLPFHRSLSRMLALLISSHLAHITNEKEIIQGRGPKNRALSSYLSLLSELLSHPSGRVCGEQINTWFSLLRDPQITKSDTILSPYLPKVLQSYINHTFRISWEDVEVEKHPMTNIIEASWDDKSDYNDWFCYQRSRSSLLFKLIGNYEPELATVIIKDKFCNILAAHGNGEPRNHLDPNTKCLTTKSAANIQFDGIYQPLDTILQGLPTWSVNHEHPLSDPEKIKIRKSVLATLNDIANSIIGWNPIDPLLRLQKANFLNSMKYIWVHDPSTLPAGVKILLEYLCAKDDWRNNVLSDSDLSGETIALRKKAGICLVSISKHIPHRLVPWLAELSAQVNTLLSTEDDLLPQSRMNLFEFLSCVATAVNDPIARANFIADVLSNSLNHLESNEVNEAISSIEGFMKLIGLTQASTNPASVTDREHVKLITVEYARLFSALNQLLSVGKRCYQAAKKRPNCGLPIQNIAEVPSNPDVITQQNFPDEGPVSINELALNDPFVPLWPRLLPILMKVVDVTLRLWHPMYQAVFLPNPIQRYVFAISDDEVYLAKKQEKDNAGVFGEGGTAGSVVKGWNRRQDNLAPRWSGWFNELRNTSFQLLGLLADQRVLFAPELTGMYPQFVAVVCNVEHLRAMEHRHFTQYLKQFVENLMVSCPVTLYQTHLAPILVPVLDHIQYRLRYTWAPIIEPNSSVSTIALSTPVCEAAAAIASRGGEEWYSAYYARGGIYTGELDSVTSEAVVEKVRVEVTRVFSDVIQTGLALRGEWALVLANQAKEEQALRKNDPSKLSVGPKSSVNNDGNAPVNADGTPRNENQITLEKRQTLRIHNLCQFLLLGNEAVAGPLVVSIIECLNYPDAYTCRRCTRICHRILETASSAERYTHLLGQRMFTIIVKAIVTEPKWMVGIEWEMIALLRDLYCRLVLGQTLQPGGQGAGMQQTLLHTNPNIYEQSKNVNNPLQGGGILCSPSDLPRQILCELPGVNTESIKCLDEMLMKKTAAKDQKEALRELLRAAAEELKQSEADESHCGVFGRAQAEESLLNQNSRILTVPDLPEKLVTKSQLEKKINAESRADALENGGLSNILA